MKLISLSLIFIIFYSCISSEIPQTTTSINQDSSASENTTTESENSSEQLKSLWKNSGTTEKTLTVNLDNAKTVQIIGEDVHTYLEEPTNFTATYCLEAVFTKTNLVSPKRIRIKVIPGKDDNIPNSKLTRFMRVNLNSDIGNDYCFKNTYEIVNGALQSFAAGDSDKDGDVDANDIGVVYKTSDICTNCSNIVASSKLVLYKYNPTINVLEKVDSSAVEYENMIFRVDTNSNSDNGQSSCSNSSCIADGYSCCQQGQCIREKNIKVSGVQADPNGFTTAEQEKFVDEFWYKKYPQFYYSCLERNPAEVTPPDITPDDPEGDASTRLQEITSDYECITELSTNSSAVPFHINPIDNSKIYTKCDITTPTASNYYEEVMKRMYTHCGCEETSDLSIMINSCPAYTYAPVYKTDSLGNITTEIESISCITPSPTQTPTPFSNLDVSVSSQTTPHRFFNINNQEIDPENLISGQSTEQEGTLFHYYDDENLFPNNGEFNMNSILGSMNVSLDGARPAKTIAIDNDKQYLVAVKSGYYTACPNCAKDSWFANFTSMPSSSYGLGLRATGYTTTRDSYSDNTTLGNYEDTIFGRACFVPPTMIPFGHLKNSNAQTQRLNRLQTQAALFANGYQRDWFGFNKGALIGSFDGVTWFAIGSGRIVKSTSTKLFLAINAPFADLASPTDHIISVQEYDYSSTGAQYDYDPTIEINASTQNQGGLCQKYHQCETDAHCVTKLGWEYSCADVTNLQTKWPSFNPSTGEEIANTEREGTLVDFLQQAKLPAGSTTKRCVYRGAGAPCRVEYAKITDEGLRKNLTCAPNFYCANIKTANVFNKEVARFGKPLDQIVEGKNHHIGQDANVLGRPKDYISGTSLTSLPLDIQNNIESNVLLSDSTATNNIGICRPGKKLPDYMTANDTNNWHPSNHHEAADTAKRTDYISQIGSCNSSLYTNLRYSSCPMLDEDGNYIHTQDNYLNDAFPIPGLSGTYVQQFVSERYTTSQNACGLESLQSGTNVGIGITSSSLRSASAFESIEGQSLATSDIQIEKTLAENACLRKPGAVCHTDLDCSPNRLQASVIDLINPSFFGNEAEKKYFEEYLICGQAESKPLIGDDNYNTFDIHNNKCCRPVGSEITMFTEDTPDVLESTGLRSDKFGSFHPGDADRYSRYSVAEPQNGLNAIDKSTKLSNIIRPTANTEDSNNDHNLDNTPNITTKNQWKTIHTTAAKTCCGGSWVRKFADGTTNWQTNRMNIDITKFSCLNYQSPLYLASDSSTISSAYNLTSGQLDADRNRFCTDMDLRNGGCAATPIGEITSLSTISKPTLNTTTSTMILDSDDTVMENQWANNLWTYAPLIPYDNGINLILDWRNQESDVQRKNIVTRLPAFIPHTNPISTSGLLIKLINPDSGLKDSCTRVNSDATPTATHGISGPLDPWTSGACLLNTSNCCYTYNQNTRILRVAHNNNYKDPTRFPSSYDKNNLSMEIEFTAPGTLLWEQTKVGANAVTDQSYLEHRRSSAPGNSLYYLKKLARFEYIGIPQMTYEPIYCNDNYQKMVPGLFKDQAFGQALETVNDFLNHDKTFVDPDGSGPWSADSAGGSQDANALNLAYSSSDELVDHPAIFSDNKFKCCRELGAVVTDESICCSGFATDNPNPNPESNNPSKICKLPVGTNLNVYFNKFVSGEGLKDDMPVPALTTADFDTRTGEPLVSTSVLTKLNALGQEYCENGTVRRGGAFGNFAAQPLSPVSSNSTNGDQYSIIDSYTDDGNINNQKVGYQVYGIGFRWNHHVYCDLSSQ